MGAPVENPDPRSRVLRRMHLEQHEPSIGLQRPPDLLERPLRIVDMVKRDDAEDAVEDGGTKREGLGATSRKSDARPAASAEFELLAVRIDDHDGTASPREGLRDPARPTPEVEDPAVGRQVEEFRYKGQIPPSLPEAQDLFNPGPHSDDHAREAKQAGRINPPSAEATSA